MVALTAFSIAALIAVLLPLPVQGGFQLNNRPAVGILTKPVTSSFLSPYGTSEFSADYVKWVESAGAEVIPINYNATKAELDSLLTSVNAVLFTGGGLDLTPGHPYFDTAQYIYSAAKRMNDEGDFFPLWGTCMGFQLLSILAAGNASVLEGDVFDSENLPLALEDLDIHGSRMFEGVPERVLATLTRTNSTMNLHHDGVAPHSFVSVSGLRDTFRLLSINHDREGRVFASTMEGWKYPFFGTQWHPERNAFEWDEGENLDKHERAIEAMQYMANRLVHFARFSHHAFPSFEEREKRAIYHWSPVYTGNDPTQTYKDRQTYVFDL
uniref:folate gamma-glutamyl hydrolase n=1 Tax=Palpitomonas bilix TaxID=652834 RepID=A0A7S3D4K5_9EUKA|mmetsp:Transcript_19549/g.50064  ORF Transcript_19549/g.50064 Transcript_19549/m.50064 type:complete len:325 (+) Transcript_19549:50-1024(+)